MHIYCCCHAVNLLQRDAPCAGNCFFPGKAALLAESHSNDIAQKGKTLAMQRFTRTGIFQFGAEFCNDS